MNVLVDDFSNGNEPSGVEALLEDVKHLKDRVSELEDKLEKALDRIRTIERNVESLEYHTGRRWE